MARGPWPRSGVRTRLPVVFRRVVDEFSPSDISGLALWLDASANGDLYTTDAGPVVPVSSPTEISGCVGWWDASDASSITQSGGLVSQLNDKSGQNNHATASGGLRPTLTGNALNGRSVLTFGGSQGLTGNLTTSVSSNAYSVFAVCRITAATTNARVFSVSNAGADFASGMVIPCLSNGGTLTAFSGTSGVNLSQVTGFSSYAVFAGVLSSNLVANAANGMSNAAVSATLSATLTRFGIGIAAQGGSANQTGDIAEIIYYNTALSTADRARVEAYLAAKWGISGVHAAATSASDPVGYWRDRSGNGRHATQATGASRPTISATVLNGKRQVGFNNANRIITPAFLARATSTYAIVLSRDFSDTLGAVFQVGGVNGFHNFFTEGSGGRLLFRRPDSTTGQIVLTTGVGESNTPDVWVLDYSPSSLSIRRNGAVVGTSAVVSPLSDATLATIIGSLDTGAVGYDLTGRIAEFCVYGGKNLSASERQRLERYLAAKWGIVLAPQVSNADAQDWINRVYANGGTVTASTAAAVNQFCLDIENAPGGSIRDRFYRLNLFCGTGLNACLVPLYRGQSLGGTQFGGAVDANVGGLFVSGDYAETNGLDGDGTNKYLNTGMSPDNMGVPATVHLAAFKGAGAWTTSREFIGTRDADDLYQFQMRYPASLVPSASVLLGGSVSIINEVAVSTAASFLIATRTSSSDLFLWQNGAKIATGTTSATTPGACANPYMVFTRNASGTAASGQWEHALRAYSIGLGLNDSQAVAYNTAMQTFQTALGRNV